MAPQHTTQKQKASRARRGPTDGDSSPDGQELLTGILPNSLLMNATSSLEKRAKKKQQHLQSRFKLQMNKIMKEVEERSKSRSSASGVTGDPTSSGARRRQLLILAGLAKDRAQIEQQIVRRLQSLSNAYETASQTLAGTLGVKAARLQQ
ncbi:hypothetical protein KEM56_006432 [Ascosphaera pollenicola]|nr:hypothetical protein KEM56_006432 [Ascosphaera pollenicola]